MPPAGSVKMFGNPWFLESLQVSGPAGTRRGLALPAQPRAGYCCSSPCASWTLLLAGRFGALGEQARSSAGDSPRSSCPRSQVELWLQESCRVLGMVLTSCCAPWRLQCQGGRGPGGLCPGGLLLPFGRHSDPCVWREGNWRRPLILVKKKM